MDTAAKRASSISVFLPWGILPAPDGAGIGLADRQHTGWDYLLAFVVEAAPRSVSIAAWLMQHGVAPALHAHEASAISLL